MIRLQCTRGFHNGRAYLQFTPTFSPTVCATGTLTFAGWQAWEDEPHTIAAAQASAVRNVRDVLATFAKDFATIGAVIDPIPPQPEPTDAERLAAANLQIKNAVSIMQQSLRAIDAHRRNSGGEGDIDAANIRGFLAEHGKGETL